MRVPVLGRIAVVAVLLYACAAPDDLWLGMHFVWGSPRIEVEAAAD